MGGTLAHVFAGCPARDGPVWLENSAPIRPSPHQEDGEDPGGDVGSARMSDGDRCVPTPSLPIGYDHISRSPAQPRRDFPVWGLVPV
jgi:hypothetical protein